ncbi:MAG TPA: DUF962 domain-containing protein [Flavobacteriia bacterium]|nr:DUF962 domain-containing protein [Flavobacteriia bacterium]
MKTLNQWFEEYAESHQNEINAKIHYVCVPVIFFSIVGMLLSINASFLQELFPIKNPIFVNWAVVFLIFVLGFYLTLSLKTFFQMLAFSMVSLVLNYFLSKYVSLFYFNLVLFIIAWIGQFYGHKIEGKKPSFFKDLQFLLIGPAWVFKKMFS